MEERRNNIFLKTSYIMSKIIVIFRSILNTTKQKLFVLLKERKTKNILILDDETKKIAVSSENNADVYQLKLAQHG